MHSIVLVSFTHISPTNVAVKTFLVETRDSRIDGIVQWVGYLATESQVGSLIPHSASREKKQPVWPWTSCKVPGHPLRRKER